MGEANVAPREGGRRADLCRRGNAPVWLYAERLLTTHKQIGHPKRLEPSHPNQMAGASLSGDEARSNSRRVGVPQSYLFREEPRAATDDGLPPLVQRT